MIGFWDSVIDLHEKLSKLCKKKLPTECIALNFGEWESRIAQDAHSLDCHGHCHFVLTGTAHERLSKMKSMSNRSGKSPLEGRSGNPTNYSVMNVQVLEEHRLLSDEVKNIDRNVKNVEKKMEEYHTETLTKFSELDNKFDKLERKWDNKFDKLERKLVSLMDSNNSKLFGKLEKHFSLL